LLLAATVRSFALMPLGISDRNKSFPVEPVPSLKLVCNLKHLSCEQFHQIIKGDSTLLGTSRNLQNIHGLNRLSK